MKHVTDAHNFQVIDDVVHVNRTLVRGCPACGAVDAKESTTPSGRRLVLHHNPVECCAWACNRAAAQRDAEAQQVQNALDDEEASVGRLEQEAEDATGREKDRITKRAERARSGVYRKRQDVYVPRLRELYGERNRLRQKRDLMRNKGDTTEDAMGARS